MWHLCRLIFVAAILSSSSTLNVAQTRTPVSPAKGGQAVSPSTERPTADETFELNIDERRITEDNFEAATAVGTRENSHGLNLQIGVALSAARIDVLLRNVRGRVRFRGSIERVLDLLNTTRRNDSPP